MGDLHCRIVTVVSVRCAVRNREISWPGRGKMVRFESNQSNLHGFHTGGKDLLRYNVLFARLVTDDIQSIGQVFGGRVGENRSGGFELKCVAFVPFQYRPQAYIAREVKLLYCRVVVGSGVWK